MLEIPEAHNLAKQINSLLINKKVVEVIANKHQHKLAWFYGDTADYNQQLFGKTVQGAFAYGGLVEIKFQDVNLVIGDGANLQYFQANQKEPIKHQLLIKFEDGAFLTSSVKMYGGIWCFKNNSFDNIYYTMAKEKPSPLSAQFNYEYFTTNILDERAKNKSIKAVLATKQSIPGLGNGVLQDILFNAKINPKRKVSTLNEIERLQLFDSVKNTLKEMSNKGGRDTETDLFGAKGGYKTKMTSSNAKQPCPDCKSEIIKEAYLGGSIYYCPNCQKL